MDDVDPHAVNLDLLQALGEGLNGPLHVGLDDDRQGLHFTLLHRVKEVVQGHVTSAAPLFIFGPLSPFFPGGPGRLFVVKDNKVVPGFRHPVEPGNFDWRRWGGVLDPPAVFVGHRPDPTKGVADHDWVPYVQGPLLNQEGGYGPLPLVEAGFHHCPSGVLVWVRL